MTYTAGRIVNDADAHTMETQDWLAPCSLLGTLGLTHGGFGWEWRNQAP